MIEKEITDDKKAYKNMPKITVTQKTESVKTANDLAELVSSGLMLRAA